jgi:UDP:flavonoid glycosyltransferase YjiC (YdhE family)
MLPDLLTLGDTWRPDLVVWDNVAFAGAVAAEYWDVPHASVKTTNLYGHYPDRVAILPPLEMLRASVRLPPDPTCAMQFRYLHFICEPPQFQDPNEIPPPTAHRLRRAIFDQSGTERLPTWVDDLPRQPTIYATLGTDLSRQERGRSLFPIILEALHDEPCNLILTIGRENDPAQYGPQPGNVRIERYIPQSLILPHCDLVLSHCGSGTAMAALDVGIPMVNLPFIGADQPENAARCAEMGVALTVPPEERRADGIRAAVRAVLATPHYRENAARARAAMAAMPGPEHAVTLLERLAVEKRPITHENGQPSPVAPVPIR